MEAFMHKAVGDCHSVMEAPAIQHEQGPARLQTLQIHAQVPCYMSVPGLSDNAVQLEHRVKLSP